MLHIKKNEAVTQLVIRADTSLGNILLNIGLKTGLPLKMADDQKGVILTCIPNPPIDSKSGNTETTFLIRNKNCAEEILNKLREYMLP